MTKIIDRAGSGAAITETENDDNLDSLSGVNVVDATTSLTITVAHQNDTIEFTNAGAVAVTLDSLATILTATHTTDFKVTLLNTGAGTVTITPDGTNTINTGDLTIELATDEYVTIQNDSTNIIWNIVSVNGVKALIGVTSTAAELNILDGVTATAAELNVLDGMTSTTAELNIIDGSATVQATVTLAGTDGVVISDADVMKQCLVSDFKTYITAGLNTKLIDIGSWDMDATNTYTTAHGLTYSKIRRATAVILRDDGGFGRTIDGEGFVYWDASDVVAVRDASGYFDSTNYNDAGIDPRGHIIIEYTD